MPGTDGRVPWNGHDQPARVIIIQPLESLGGTGIGYYVWNEWNNLDLASVIFSILMIGIVGMLLDMILGSVTHLVQYQE